MDKMRAHAEMAANTYLRTIDLKRLTWRLAKWASPHAHCTSNACHDVAARDEHAVNLFVEADLALVFSLDPFIGRFRLLLRWIVFFAEPGEKILEAAARVRRDKLNLAFAGIVNRRSDVP